MDRKKLAEVCREWTSLWCAPPDWSLFERLHADDFVDHSPAGRLDTKEGFRQGLEQLVAAFPDLRTRVHDLVIDEETNRVAVRWSASGTNRARFLGTGPTHGVVHMTGIEIIEIKEGRITARWGEWDIGDFLQGQGSGGPARRRRGGHGRRVGT